MKVIILGCGSVGKCVLYYLTRFIKVSYKNVIIVDCNKKTCEFPSVQEALRKGSKFIHFTITSSNFGDFFENVLKIEKGDLVLDLTTRTPCFKFVIKCRQLQAHYLSTSTEEDEDHMELRSHIQESIWIQHGILKDIAKKTEHYGPATSMIDFGANPGMISIFVKQGILDIAKYVLQHKKDPVLAKALKSRNYSDIGKLLKIRTIHCSEIDTQVPRNKVKHDYVNTWSCVGMIDEAVEVTELNIGTHEKTLPFPSKLISYVSPQAIIVNKPSKDIFFRSYLPKSIDPITNDVTFTEIKGCCIHHSENMTLNHYLATDEWAPTMHYVYRMSPYVRKFNEKYTNKQLVAIADDPNRWKVLNVYDDAIEGYDNVGATFILEEDPITNAKKPWGWWTGSILGTDYTKNVLKDPYFGPTPMVVMAGLLSAASWILKNPNKGIAFAEELSTSFVLRKSKPFLGTYFSGPITGCKIAGYTLKDLVVSPSTPKHPTKYNGQI